MTQRLGVLGGTFDPVHVGHLAAAVNARVALDLDRVLLVVANQPWQKSGREITSAEDRLAMVQAAVADRDGLESSRIEIDRGGDTYTADTLEQLAAEDPDRDLFLIVGTDVAADLDTWKRPDVVARLATLVVVGRPGPGRGRASTPAPPGPPGREWRIERVDMPPLDISSSDLRDRHRRGLPLDYLVPDPVITEIRRRGLYSGDTMTTGSGGR
jgi:nicotinate-nucleotide adenylyltransferase